MHETSVLLEQLLEERRTGYDVGLYADLQQVFAYESNAIEGCRIDFYSVREMFEHGRTLGAASLDDVVSVANHFRAFDIILDTIGDPLDEELMCRLHSALMWGTDRGLDPRYAIGRFKQERNIIVSPLGDRTDTTAPGDVEAEISSLLSGFREEGASLADILAFHVRFERIHPFSDRNGRIGRLLLFRSCLRSGTAPFLFRNRERDVYFDGITRWDDDPSVLTNLAEALQTWFERRFEEAG